MFNYSDKVKDHFQHPRHRGALTELDIDRATERLVLADAGQAQIDDAVRLSLRIRVADECILDARFESTGTGTGELIPSASCLCSLIIGKTLKDALAISALDLDRELEGLPELRRRRPVLALEALGNAARQFRGLPATDGAVKCEANLCNCFQVPRSRIEKAIRLLGLKTVAEVTATTHAGGGCQSCHPLIEELLKSCRQKLYRVHISKEEFDAAYHIYGVPRPAAKDLADNPPPAGTATDPDSAKGKQP